MKSVKIILSLMLLIILEGALVFGSPKQALADIKSGNCMDIQIATDLSPEIVDEHTKDLLFHIRNAIEDGLRYNKSLDKANSEDRLVLKLQIFSLQVRGMNYVNQLGDSLLELEKKSPHPGLRKQVESIYECVALRLFFHIRGLSEEIDAARAKRPDASADARSAIEYDVRKYAQRLDTFFKMSHRHILKMEQVGLDVKKVKQDFIELLTKRSDRLSGRLQLSVYRIEDLDARLNETPDNADIKKLLIAAQKNLATNTTSMSIVLDIMDKLNKDTNGYREQLVTTTRDISSGLVNTGVAVSLMESIFDNIKGWLVEKGPQYFIKLLILIFILFACRFTMRMVRVGLEKVLDSSNVNLSMLARHMIVASASNLVMVFGVLIALSQLGISLGPLLAGLGVAGFIVGFALQDTLGNFASGMMILLYRPYDIGDLVDVGGVYGKVNKMSLVSTCLLTLDNQTIVIPNSMIWGGVIKNVTAQDIRRVDMVFGISYDDDISKAELILNDILTTHNLILETPEPLVRVHTLGESSVDFVVRPWVRADDYWDVYWDVTKTVKLKFDEQGVSIPFPQRDVHVHNGNIIDSTKP